MKWRRVHFLLLFLLGVTCAFPFRSHIRRLFVLCVQKAKGLKTVSDRVNEYGPEARSRLAPDFDRLGISYPPNEIVLVGLKNERLLEVWVSQESSFHLLKTYPILGSSGTLGPKLVEGDRQVPEGLYRVESLNPNSRFHLSLRVNYPNPFDRKMGKQDGREFLGSDIMIHGGTATIGCIPIGDEAIEELFVLVAEAGVDRVNIILSPVDFRVRDLPLAPLQAPPWSLDLYRQIRERLGELNAYSH